MNKKILNRQGFLQAFSVSLYCLFVGLFMGNANKIFGTADTMWTPVFVLLLFSMSALICAVLVLYKPYKVFVEGKKGQALNIVISTALWLFIFFAVFFLALVVLK